VDEYHSRCESFVSDFHVPTDKAGLVVLKFDLLRCVCTVPVVSESGTFSCQKIQWESDMDYCHEVDVALLDF
jgi:hypothetical protein